MKEIEREKQILVFLGIIGEIARCSLLLMETEQVNEPVHMIKIFKYPMGIHLVESSFEILMDLVKAFFPFAKNSSQDDPFQKIYSHCFYSVLLILKAHLKALSSCHLSLQDCISSNASFQEIQEVFLKVVFDPLDTNLFIHLQTNSEKEIEQFYKALQEQTSDLFTYGISLVMKNQSKIISALRKSLKQINEGNFSSDLTEALIERLTFKQNLNSLSNETFINTPHKIINLLEDAIKLDLSYFDKELAEFVRSIDENENKDEKNESNTIPVRKSLSKLIFTFIQQILITQGCGNIKFIYSSLSI